MKKLGAYISPLADTASSSPYFTKGCFVYYEYSSDILSILPRIHIWRLDTNLNQNPDEIIFLKSPDELKKHIEPHETWANHHISYRDRTYRILDMKCRFTRFPDIEVIDELTLDSIDHYAGETWRHDDSSAYQFLKEAKLCDHPLRIFADLNSYYGMGGFTTRPVLSPEEIGELFDKKMTVTDMFLKDLTGITITSTYSKLEQCHGMPYYIYYPEMEITEDIADTLLTVLLMAKRDFIRKVVFNPEKGTTTISKSTGDPVTVRCRDGEFDYILGYEMARSKRYIGSNDYNWFNKIKNHRKTHIEYTEKPTEPKTKRTSKKGGKKS